MDNLVVIRCRPPQPITMGDKLRALRELHRLSQQEVADRLKIDQSVISWAETGRKPPKPEQLQLLVDLYHTTARDLGPEAVAILKGTVPNGKARAARKKVGVR